MKNNMQLVAKYVNSNTQELTLTYGDEAVSGHIKGRKVATIMQWVADTCRAKGWENQFPPITRTKVRKNNNQTRPCIKGEVVLTKTDKRGNVSNTTYVLTILHPKDKIVKIRHGLHAIDSIRNSYLKKQLKQLQLFVKFDTFRITESKAETLYNVPTIKKIGGNIVSFKESIYITDPIDFLAQTAKRVAKCSHHYENLIYHLFNSLPKQVSKYTNTPCKDVDECREALLAKKVSKGKLEAFIRNATIISRLRDWRDKQKLQVSVYQESGEGEFCLYDKVEAPEATQEGATAVAVLDSLKRIVSYLKLNELTIQFIQQLDGFENLSGEIKEFLKENGICESKYHNIKKEFYHKILPVLRCLINKAKSYNMNDPIDFELYNQSVIQVIKNL